MDITPWGFCSPGTLRDSCKGAQETGQSLSMGALLGEPGGGSFTRGPESTKGRIWGQASLFLGAQLGSLEWACLQGTLRYS
jgi:hypothetical protein